MARKAKRENRRGFRNLGHAKQKHVYVFALKNELGSIGYAGVTTLSTPDHMAAAETVLARVDSEIVELMAHVEGFASWLSGASYVRLEVRGEQGGCTIVAKVDLSGLNMAREISALN